MPEDLLEVDLLDLLLPKVLSLGDFKSLKTLFFSLSLAFMLVLRLTDREFGPTFGEALDIVAVLFVIMTPVGSKTIISKVSCVFCVVFVSTSGLCQDWFIFLTSF